MEERSEGVNIRLVHSPEHPSFPSCLKCLLIIRRGTYFPISPFHSHIQFLHLPFTTFSPFLHHFLRKEESSTESFASLITKIKGLSISRLSPNPQIYGSVLTTFPQRNDGGDYFLVPRSRVYCPSSTVKISREGV